MSESVGLMRYHEQSIEPSEKRPSPRGLPRSKQLRIKMVLFLVTAFTTMIAHDQFYSYLANKPILFGQSTVGLFLQQYYSAVGNFIALLGRFAMSLAIGTAFVQIFWLNLRTHKHTVADIDSAMGCKDSPFGFGSLLSWRHMFWLSVLPALATGNAQIIVFASGSVQVEYAPADANCTMATVDLSGSAIGVLTENSSDTVFSYFGPAAQTRGFVAQVIMSGENFAPYILSEQQVNTLAYNVSFNAPALNCTNLTSTFDFATNLPLPASFGDRVMIWNTTYRLGSGNLELDVATRSLNVNISNFNDVTVGDLREAVTCMMYNATYFVEVNQTFSGDIFVEVLEMTLNDPLTNMTTSNYEDIQMNAVADSFARLLNGTAFYDPSAFDFTPESPIIVYSPLGEVDNNNPWFWTEDFLFTLPSLMANVSISLLSGKLSESGAPTLKQTETYCEITSLYFIYNRSRLLLSYSAGLLVTLICMLFGFYAVDRNGVEETLDFSRILRSVVNESLMNAKDHISDETVVQASKDRAAELELTNSLRP